MVDIAILNSSRPDTKTLRTSTPARCRIKHFRSSKMKKNNTLPATSLKEYVEKFNTLSSIFNTMPTGVFSIIDQDLNIASINATATKILHTDTGSLIGRKATDIFDSHFPGLKKLIKDTFETRQPIRNFNMEIEDENGELKTYLVSTALTEETPESDFGAILVMHDISEVTKLRKAVQANQSFGSLIGSTQTMKDVYSLIETVAQYDTSVLIFGQTGTGKELVARTIHQYSKRANGPFIPVNCSALTSTILESELFGHVRGAFTGATEDRPGRFEMAKGGTLFLDEIGTLSGDIQIKLLRTIQERIIERVGSAKPIPIDVRIVSASNQDLSILVSKQQFRDDLYYRLKVFQITIPPLRERQADIPLLADTFIDRFNKLYNRNVLGMSVSAKELLMHYFWPGNVRELENAIEHAMVLAPGKILEAQHLPPEIRHMQKNGAPPVPSEDLSLRTEEENLRRTLASVKWNVSKAAGILNMHRTTLWRKMREFSIERN